MSQPLTEFHWFPQLPAEKRLEIWWYVYEMEQGEVEECERLVQITYDEGTDCTVSLSPSPVLLHVNKETRTEFIRYYDVLPNNPLATPIYVQYDYDLIWIREDEFGIYANDGTILDRILSRFPVDTDLQRLALDHHILQPLIDTDSDPPSQNSYFRIDDTALRSLALLHSNLTQIEIILDKRSSRHSAMGPRPRGTAPRPSNQKKKPQYPYENSSHFSIITGHLVEFALFVQTMWLGQKDPYPLAQFEDEVIWTKGIAIALEEELEDILSTNGVEANFKVEVYARDGRKAPCVCDYCGPYKYQLIHKGTVNNAPQDVAEGWEMEELGECERLRLPGVKDSVAGVDRETFLAYEGETVVKERYLCNNPTTGACETDV
ncbi:hypothetical protein HYALB_00011079 [Hymenoscyphus albidus]|uniref:2EXR domain-containing protein n=1 Tax=Hymenoscyphus albidus TaxID=595503 RepID=A0A9N9Q370_9HELO|nr:hypothetical protein HYALB_00011079 [Hymenoscyphus albidus]